ncbi:MAG: S8 family serine peptidase [Casimicrobiaceae bacterium]
MSQGRQALRASQVRGLVRRSSLLVVFWPLLLAAAPVAMDATGQLARAAPASHFSVSRLIVRFLPGVQPGEGEVIDETLRARLEVAAGRPLGVGAPTRTGDQVLTLASPVSVIEARRIVAALRMQDGVMRVEPDRRERPRDLIKSAATAEDEGPVIRRFIVTFADPAAGALAAANGRLGQEWDDLLAAGAGVPMHVVRPTIGGAWIVETLSAVSSVRADAIAARLEAAPGIRYARPNRPAKVQAYYPDDTYFQNGHQPNLANPLTTDYYGIDAPNAWDITVGDDIVIAVVDTGVRPHGELYDRLLDGYNFIADPDTPQDGTGRAPDGNDLGTWRTAKDCTGRTADDSSWHGTHVAGIIAADSDNHEGIAGINWYAQILPIKVLGSCGGTDSDILEGMQWAAGLPVPGVPNNPNPARVINMSLGGKGACDAQYQAAIDAVLARGTFIAVAAGNESDDIDGYSPAGCYGVSTVAATDPYGFLASYSNYSVYVDIAAPGGDQSRYGDRWGIWSTANTGTKGPEYATYLAYNGTSQATPHVAGVASLMLSVNPYLTPAQLKSIMADTSSYFAPTSTCRTTGACGAGIVNAFYAVKEAVRQASIQSASIIEFYNASLDHYFVSAEPLEISALDTGKFAGWHRTGQSFNGYTHPAAGASPVCRFYIPPPFGDSHFFSASPAECAKVRAQFPAFSYEAPNVFYIDLPNVTTGACPAGDTPVYRLWNQRADTNHRYTTSIALRNQMLAKGYVAEGYGPQAVAMCSVQ